MGKRERHRSEILEDLLTVALEETMASKTRIMQRAYLNQKTFQKYFNFLVCNRYIAHSNTENGKYVVTESGKKVLNKLREMNHLLCVDIKA